MGKLMAIVVAATSLGSCDPTPAVQAACPVVPTEYGDLFGYDLQPMRAATWRWVAPSGIVYGFTMQEDGLVYQTPWCARHMPTYPPAR